MPFVKTSVAVTKPQVQLFEAADQDEPMTFEASEEEEEIIEVEEDEDSEES